MAPGKSSLHARGERERVLALESREGTRAPRRNAGIPPQLDKNHVVPTSWQDEALARHGVSRAQSPGREAALAWASLAQRFPASSLLAREGAGCGSMGDVPGAWLASAPLSAGTLGVPLKGTRHDEELLDVA